MGAVMLLQYKARLSSSHLFLKPASKYCLKVIIFFQHPLFKLFSDEINGAYKSVMFVILYDYYGCFLKIHNSPNYFFDEAHQNKSKEYHYFYFFSFYQYLFFN